MKLKFLTFLGLFIFALNLVQAETGNKDVSLYTGTFDVIDKEIYAAVHGYT